MNWFPQIGRGAIAQYPLQRKRQFRAITNLLENGERISLPDATGGQIEWGLNYQELTDEELGRITALFSASKGDVLPFGFADPFANLLGWSEDLTRPDWQKGLLTVTGGLSDPVGTLRAFLVGNTSGAEQTLAQTLGIPGEYTACFSAYVRADSSGTMGILRDSTRVNMTVGPQWKRIQISGPGTAGAGVSTLGLAISAGSSVRVFGLQVEVQPWPSPYRPTGAAAGIYQNTRFGSGDITVTSTAPGLSRCQVRLISKS